MSKNWEKEIENAVITVLQANTDITNAGYDVRQLGDLSKAETYPVILVNCDIVRPAEESYVDELIEPIVNVLVRTHRRRNSDNSGALANQIAGWCRDTITGGSFISDVNNQLTNIIVLQRELNIGNDYNEFDNIYQYNLVVELYCQII